MTNKSIPKKTLLTVSIVFIFSIILPSTVMAFGSWDHETTAREICFLYALSNDWQQTLDIAKNPDEYSEANPFLGTHPDSSKVNMYFAGCAVGHALIAYMLPPKLEKIWQITWIGVQTRVTEHNNKNGLNQDMNLAYTLTYSFEF